MLFDAILQQRQRRKCAQNSKRYMIADLFWNWGKNEKKI